MIQSMNKRMTKLARGTLPLAALLAGCGGGGRALVAGPEMVGSAFAPPTPYVVRMSDGRRDWEVELPEAMSGYEVRIPLRPSEEGSRGRISDLSESMTDADRELLSELRRDEVGLEEEGIFHGGEDLIESDARARPEPTREEPEARRAGGATSPNDEPVPSRPSYLLGIAEVRRLYRAGNVEVAMVRLTELLRAYPQDPRLLSMRGTLWLRLGRPALARRAWEQVLQRDPENRAVRAALRRLNEAEDEPVESEEL